MGQRAPLRERHETCLSLAAIVALNSIQVAAKGNESSGQAPLRELVRRACPSRTVPVLDGEMDG